MVHTPSPPRGPSRPPAGTVVSDEGALADEPDGRPHAATDDVTRLASAVAGAAEEDGISELAARVRAELARAGNRAASIVVVGEKKRGKSSLINALVGRPGLVPVDVDVATNVHIVVGHAPHALARVHDESSPPQGREIPLDEVVEYAALEPGTHRARHGGVSQVEVLTPSPLLAHGLTLIDTPGVGGLVAGHAAVTLAALDRADALLFVVSGHGELTASELAFLERAVDRVAAVVFALTQFDQAPGWREILGRNHELIARHAPRLGGAPWFVVNSRARADAQRAQAAGRPDAATRRLAASGLSELEALLTTVAADADALRLSNVVYRCAEVAGVLVAAATERATSLTLDPAFADRVEREKAGLAGLKSQASSWRTVLGDALTVADQHCRRVLNRQVEDLRLQVAEQIDTAKGTKGLREVVDGVPDRVNALWMTVHHHLVDELTSAAETVVAAAGSTIVDLSPVLPDQPERLGQLPETPRGRRHGASIAEHGMMAMGLGSVVGSLLSVVSTPAVGIPAGAAVVGLVARIRHGREEGARSQQAARQYLDRVVARVNTEVPPAVQETIMKAKGRIAEHVTTRLDNRRARLEAALAEHQKLLKAERETVTRAQDSADQRLAQRRKLVEIAQTIGRRVAPGATDPDRSSSS